MKFHPIIVAIVLNHEKQPYVTNFTCFDMLYLTRQKKVLRLK